MSVIYQFPYEEISKGDNIILYGAGNVGQSFVEQMKNNKFCNIVAIVDVNYETIASILGIRVISPEDISRYNFDKVIVSVMNNDMKNDIIKKLNNIGACNCDKIVSKNFKKYYSRDIYSDPHEVSVIRTVFDILGIDKPSYVDAGACHPHLDSNTMSFYEHGSRGVNIEPNIDLKDEFEYYRPEDFNLFVGISDKPGDLMYYRANNPSYNTFSTDSIKWHEVRSGARVESGVKVKVTTLNNIIDEYNNGKFPDFLDIDIEGMDARVLESVDFSKSSPLLICAEGDMRTFNRILMDKKCEGNGYMPYCRIGCNCIFLRKDIHGKILSL